MPNSSQDIFSFHLLRLPLLKVPRFILSSKYKKNIVGLNHSESFLTMNLGESVISPPRYNLKTVAFFAWWREESFLDNFLNEPSHQFFNNGWHVRMHLYRRWGQLTELQNADIHSNATAPDQPIVAVTLARLNLLETFRFIRWGKPVEKQVRDHKGQNLALAGIRPLNTFSTFSIWKSEAEMLNMVHGKNKLHDQEDHKLAMQERQRKDFHHEFTTLRFSPFKEVGHWNEKTNYTNQAIE